MLLFLEASKKSKGEGQKKYRKVTSTRSAKRNIGATEQEDKTKKHSENQRLEAQN